MKHHTIPTFDHKAAHPVMTLAERRQYVVFETSSSSLGSSSPFAPVTPSSWSGRRSKKSSAGTGSRRKTTNMANNRLYLKHRPSGKMLIIGAHYGSSWGVGRGLDDRADTFFDACFEATGEVGRDDFELVIENADGAPCAREETNEERRSWIKGSNPLY